MVELALILKLLNSVPYVFVITVSALALTLCLVLVVSLGRKISVNVMFMRVLTVTAGNVGYCCYVT